MTNLIIMKLRHNVLEGKKQTNQPGFDTGPSGFIA